MSRRGDAQVTLARELREGRGLSQRDHVDHGVIRRHLLRRSQAEADESQQLDRGRCREQRHREHHSSGARYDSISFHDRRSARKFCPVTWNSNDST
eukprot:COSAG06_NODE_8069_length_2283_cov_2.597070_2_plen_96_part_00